MANDYKSCMTDAMRSFPKGISREERNNLMCTNAKLCSGKAKSESEAKTLCANRPPKEPKERRHRRDGCPPCPSCEETKKAPPADLPCPQRKNRITTTIEEIMNHVKEGNAGATTDASNLLIADVKHCFPDEAAVMAVDIQNDLKKMAKEYYFKGEIHEVKEKFDLLKTLVGG